MIGEALQAAQRPEDAVLLSAEIAETRLTP